MNAFSRLLDSLVFAPQRTAKLRLIKRYFSTVGDPDRGWGLAALTGTLVFPHAKPAVIRGLMAERVDPLLFQLSYDYVGDLAETASLLWPAADGGEERPPPPLREVVATLREAPKAAVAAHLVRWLDALDASGRFALLKLMTGGLRVGVSARLAKTALAEFGGRDVADIEELWHGLDPPYAELFAWLEGRGPQPRAAMALTFRPMMLATTLAEADLADLDPCAYAAEWKWDGIRVQLAVSADGGVRIFSRTGDDITAAFPDVAATLCAPAVLDGELLVVRDGAVAPFNDLQQRLGRKAPPKSLLARHPAHVRLYDMLFDGGEDLRPLPFAARRARLEAWLARTRPPAMDLSPLLEFAGWTDLAAHRARDHGDSIEGVMLKRRDSPYLAGRPKGPWLKWKRDPLTIDCVLMYAQRGHGKRSSYYSDYTFGCWRTDGDGRRELVPVGKAYFGFTDAELRQLDRWVRSHTVERFGPVRAVDPALVLEIAFDGAQRSSRHKSGLALRFPRVHRIRWDKPAAEADTVAALTRLLPATP
ncbi:MAG: cisplatin damage response ATP-dependent DNA ligase [Rhodospirillales bacterium]|nr:cisplatin damage response ATP-dependent DNA ligase [Rhodospirillales bacterium]